MISHTSIIRYIYCNDTINKLSLMRYNQIPTIHPNRYSMKNRLSYYQSSV